MSAYETPEIRSLFNKSLTNVAGRTKTIQRYDGVLDRIRPGVKQNFVRFDASDAHAEDDARFEYFTTKVSISNRQICSVQAEFSTDPPCFAQVRCCIDKHFDLHSFLLRFRSDKCIPKDARRF